MESQINAADPEGSPHPLDVSVVHAYMDALTPDARECVSTRLIPLAQKLYDDQPEHAIELLGKILTKVASLPLDEQKAFLENDITVDTFNFQLQFKELLSPCADRFENSVFHIGKKAILMHELQDGNLVPPYMLEGESYDEEIETVWADENPEYYSVFFAEGTIDQLSAYFVGHGLLYFENNEGVAEQCFNDFPKHYALAVVSKKDTHIRGEVNQHDIETVYCSSLSAAFDIGYVDVHQSLIPVRPVTIITIPTTFALDDEHASFIAQAEEVYQNIVEKNPRRLAIKDKEQFSRAYAHERHLDIVLKYAFTRFREGIDQ